MEHHNFGRKKVTETVEHTTPYGDYIILPIDADAVEISEAKKALAHQAAQAIEIALLESDAFIVQTVTAEDAARSREINAAVEAIETAEDAAAFHEKYGDCVETGLEEPCITIGWKVYLASKETFNISVIDENVKG